MTLSEGLVVAILLFLFMVLAAFSFSHKSVVGDTMLHYYTGELALGKDWAAGDPLGWDGTMPISALNVLADRFYLVFVPTPKYPEVMPFATVNRPFIASLPNMLQGAAVVLLIWICGRRWLGKAGGLFAAILAATEPNSLGNARWITTDVPATLTFLAGLFAIALYLEKPRLRHFYFMALIIAIAQLAKVTNLILIGFSCLAICVVELQVFLHSLKQSLWSRESLSPISQMVIGILTKFTFVLLSALFALQLGYMGYDPEISAEIRATPEIVETWAAPFWAATPFVPAPYAYTLAQARVHNHNGHSSFFWGKHNTHGDWRYFPFAILVKTPLPILILAFVGLLNLKRFSMGLLFILSASSLYFIYFCFFVHVNIGIRHVLPVFPAIILLAGAGATKVWEWANDERLNNVKWPMLGLLGGVFFWSVLVNVMIYPHYASYFNPIVGGSYEGWKYLSDSNVDFDQDRNQIREWIAQQSEPVHLHPRDPVHGLIVTRALLLNGITAEDREAMSWLRDHYEPIERLSPAVFVYRVP